MYVIDTVNQQVKKFSKKELASFLNQIVTNQFLFANNKQKATKIIKDEIEINNIDDTNF